MAKTTSWAFPNMINITQNCVNIAEDNKSITNRTKLLLLTEPTELYNEPEFGTGLRKYLWQYNTENTKARLKDTIVEKLHRYEPCVDAEKTSFADGLLFSEGVIESEGENPNVLKLTIGLQTIFKDVLQIDTSDLQQLIDAAQVDQK